MVVTNALAESVEFPLPGPGDPEDVAWALETAGALWARGDAREAVRWLRRAAETASDAGLDGRAVALARVAADLTTELKLPPSIPPPASGAGGDTIPRAPRTGVGPTRRATLETPAMTPQMAAGARDRRDSPSVGWGGDAPSSRDAPSTSVGAPPSSDEAPITRASERPPEWSDSDRTLAEDDEPTVRGDPPVELHRARQRASGAGRPRQALRVSVTPSSDDRGLLLVRVLEEHETAPEGAHEAMLVAFEPGAHLMARRR